MPLDAQSLVHSTCARNFEKIRSATACKSLKYQELSLCQELKTASVDIGGLVEGWYHTGFLF